MEMFVWTTFQPKLSKWIVSSFWFDFSTSIFKGGIYINKLCSDFCFLHFKSYYFKEAKLFNKLEYQSMQSKVSKICLYKCLNWNFRVLQLEFQLWCRKGEKIWDLSWRKSEKSLGKFFQTNVFLGDLRSTSIETDYKS